MYPKGPKRTDANVNSSFSSGWYLNGFTSTQRNEISNSLHTRVNSLIFKAAIRKRQFGWGTVGVLKSSKNSFSPLTVYQKMSNQIQPIVKHWDLPSKDTGHKHRRRCKKLSKSARPDRNVKGSRYERKLEPSRGSRRDSGNERGIYSGADSNEPKKVAPVGLLGLF